MIALYLHKIFISIKRAVLKREEEKLEFESVQKAVCSQKLDDSRIKEAIAGFEEEVDNSILMLKSVGRYDRDVKFNLDRGMMPDLAQAGINPYKIAVGCIAWLFWYIADWTRAYGIFLSTSIVIALTATAIGSAWLIGEKVIFLVEASLYFGMLFVIVAHHPFFFDHRNSSGGFMDIRSILLEVVCAL